MKKSINKVILLTLLTIGIISCKKQFDINVNPNQPSSESISAELILPNALHGVGVQSSVGFLSVTGSYSSGYGWLNNWMGYWSASGSFNPSTEESSYNITNTFEETRWRDAYNVLFDLDQVEQKATESNQPFYRGVSMISKAHLFQNLVDMYGNIPYSQAFKPAEFPAPAYDKAEDIYANLHVKLDEAIEILKAATVTTTGKTVDIVYNGDTNKWIKFANTIKLRLLIRTSEINSNPATELAKIKANGGVLQSGETADANPGYQNDLNKQSPFYSAYGLLPSGTEANTFYRANAAMIDRLKNTNDPRLNYFFAKAKSPTNAANPYVGTVYGSEPNTAFGGDQTSNIGPGLIKSPAQSQWILTSVESMFLQAEAIARGWDIGGPFIGNAKAAYEAAVIESFIWLGVTDAATSAATFLQSSTANWSNAGSTTQSRVNFIVTQKYIALTGINPLEAWSDYRRLGVPSDIPLSINTARGNRTIPVRLFYPSAEYAVNAASVQAQGTINPQTSRLFWDK